MAKLAGRTLSRAQAFQVLFQAEATERSVADVLADTPCVTDGPMDAFALSLARGAGEHLADIDATIRPTIDRWAYSRVTDVDRNLLRVAVYEMKYLDDVDIPVSINEAVKLAKAFGTDDSYQFVNGVLGRVARLLESQQSGSVDE